MIKQRYWMAIPVVASIGMLAGCSQMVWDALTLQTNLDAKNLAKVQSEETDALGERISKEHEAQTPELADRFAEIRTEFIEDMEKIGARIDGLKTAHQPFIEGVARAVAETVLPVPVSKLLDKIKANIKDLDTEVDTANVERAERTVVLASLKDELAAANERLAGLDAGTRENLANVSKNTEAMRKLESLQDNDKVFREALQKQANLTDKEMEGLKGLSTEEIMAMLAAAGVAAAGGGALGKTGKSRGHAEIEKLKDAINDITTAAARELPSPSAEAIVSHGTKPGKTA